jgi:integrase/recombinase XerD
MLIEYSLLHSHRSSVYQVEAVMYKGLDNPTVAISLSHAGSLGRVEAYEFRVSTRWRTMPAMFDTTTPQLPAPTEGQPIPSTLDALASLPEEEVWLASRKSRETRQAHAGDVRRFMRLLGITSREALRQVDRKIMRAYARHLREVQRLHPTTIRRRLSALSSLFRHLVQFEVIAANPVQAIDRPAINRWQGMTPAFSPQEAQALLDAPDPTTGEGLRARAILSLGLQVGLRQSEIMRLKVRDLHTTGGYDALRVIRKHGKRDVIVIHPETAQRLRAYLAAAGHGQDRDPLFRRLARSGSEQDQRRPLRPERVEWVVRTYTQQIDLGRGYSSHAMRTTFITTALANGATLEDVRRTVGHADPATTQLYDRGQFTPQKSAALLVAY